MRPGRLRLSFEQLLDHSPIPAAALSFSTTVTWRWERTAGNYTMREIDELDAMCTGGRTSRAYTASYGPIIHRALLAVLL